MCVSLELMGYGVCGIAGIARRIYPPTESECGPRSVSPTWLQNIRLALKDGKRLAKNDSK